MRIAVISCALAATLAFAGADNPYGACAHITRAEFPPARTCDMMRQVGMGWVRASADGLASAAVEFAEPAPNVCAD